ncbi:hypothetical protein [Nocardia gipuzkoensis]
MSEHDRREQLRVSASQLWHPVGPAERVRRVDVFGGTADGWSSLLGTLGMSLLAQDAQLLVLDFTEQQVAADLAALARASEHAVSVVDLPGGGVGLLEGLSPRQIGETVAEALSTLRSAETRSAHVSALDAELVTRVAEALAAPVTFGRLAAGVRVLRSIYEAEHENWLSAGEILQGNDQSARVLSRSCVRHGPSYLALAGKVPTSGRIPRRRGIAIPVGLSSDDRSPAARTEGLGRCLVSHRILSQRRSHRRCS